MPRDAHHCILQPDRVRDKGGDECAHAAVCLQELKPGERETAQLNDGTTGGSPEHRLGLLCQPSPQAAHSLCRTLRRHVWTLNMAEWESVQGEC